MAKWFEQGRESESLSGEMKAGTASQVASPPSLADPGGAGAEAAGGEAGT